MPKQFATLAGKPMLAHSYRALAEHPEIDEVLVVIGDGQADALVAAIGPARFVIEATQPD